MSLSSSKNIQLDHVFKLWLGVAFFLAVSYAAVAWMGKSSTPSKLTSTSNHLYSTQEPHFKTIATLARGFSKFGPSGGSLLLKDSTTNLTADSPTETRSKPKGSPAPGSSPAAGDAGMPEKIVWIPVYIPTQGSAGNSDTNNNSNASPYGGSGITTMGGLPNNQIKNRASAKGSVASETSEGSSSVYLSASDLQLVTQPGLSMTFDPTSYPNDSGYTCVQNGGSYNCQNQTVSSLNVSNTFWNQDHGLSNTTIHASSNGSSVQFNIVIQIVDTSGATQNESFALTPTTAVATGPNTQRTIEFEFPEVNLSNTGDELNQVYMRMMFNGNNMSNGSVFQFSRSGFYTQANSTWSSSYTPGMTIYKITSPVYYQFALQ